jgi:hypothetical protein
MRTKLISTCAVLIAAFLLVTNPMVADAAKLITGGQIKNNTVTGKDVKEASLAAVPKANGLTPLKSGQTQSGAFSAAGANSTGAGGWIAFEINYLRPLASPIADDHIIDTAFAADAAHCPGAGHAAPGYLCLYPSARSNVGEAYGYSDDSPYSQLPKSVGIGLYVPVTGSQPYYNGVWTVTAP